MSIHKSTERWTNSLSTGSRSLHGLIKLQRKQMMGAKGVRVLVVLFFCLCNPASLHPLSQTLPMVHLQANTEYKGEQEYLNDARSPKIIPHHGRKLQHAFGTRGVTGGQVAGAGGDGNGGGSHSTYPQGGAVIPVYAASAKGHHNNHHGAGSCIHLSIGPPALTTILLAYLLLTDPFGFK